MRLNAQEVANLEIGLGGSKAITGTVAVTPPTGKQFYKIKAITACVVASQIDTVGEINAVLAGLGSIPAGSEIYVRLSSLTLTSGTAIGYLMSV